MTSCTQDDAENALEAATEPEGELEEPTPSLDKETPTVCDPPVDNDTLLYPLHAHCRLVALLHKYFASGSQSRAAHCSLVGHSVIPWVAQVPGGADEWGPAGGGEMGSVDEADVEKQERSEVQQRWADNIQEAPDTPAEPQPAEATPEPAPPASHASAPASASATVRPTDHPALFIFESLSGVTQHCGCCRCLGSTHACFKSFF